MIIKIKAFSLLISIVCPRFAAFCKRFAKAFSQGFRRVWQDLSVFYPLKATDSAVFPFDYYYVIVGKPKNGFTYILAKRGEAKI